MYHVNRRVHTLGLTDRDHAVLTNLTHGVCDQLTDLSVVIGGNGRYLLDLVEVIAYHYRVLLDLSYHSSHSLVDTAFQIQRISACRHVLQTHAYDSLSQNRCRCCSITCLIACLGSNFLHELCTYVLGSVFQHDLFSNCHTVFCDMRRTVLSVNNYITTLRTQRHLNGVSQLIHTTLQRLSRLYIIGNILCHNF